MNRVQLNLPSHGSVQPPEPDQPLVRIDGLPIDALISINIDCAVGRNTIVSVSFYADAIGIVQSEVRQAPRTMTEAQLLAALDQHEADPLYPATPSADEWPGDVPHATHRTIWNPRNG